MKKGKAHYEYTKIELRPVQNHQKYASDWKDWKKFELPATSISGVLFQGQISLSSATKQRVATKSSHI